MPKIATNFIEVHICFMHNNARKYLLLKRSKRNKIYPGIWQMITATVEPKEKTRDSIIREVKEETGLTANKIYVIPRVNTFYLAVSDVICLSSVFLVLTKSKEVRISHEHDDYRWVTYEQAKKLIYWDNQTDSLKLIEKHFRNKASYNKLVEITL